MLPALTVALPAAPAPETHAPPRQPAAHPFAELLRQNQVSAAPSPASGTSPVDEAGSDDCAPAGATESARPTDAQRERKLALRTSANRRAGVPTEAPAQPAQADTDERPTTRKGGPDGPPADPGMPAWLADWRPLPAEPAHADAAGGEAAAGENGKGLAGAVTAKRAGLSTDAGDAARTGIAVDDRADGQRFALSAAAERLALAAATGDSAPKAVDNAVAMESSPVSTPALPSLPSLALPAMPAAHAAPGTVPVAVGVPTPFGSPDFAASFGLQVSLLARDGHQRAELRLNPAEMGPVSVQIVVDGTQARIDFGADVAATRQAIEAGLPELASALRDAGLTLHGGGVSSHAGNGGSERGERDTGTARAREPSLDGAPEAHTPRIWRHATGGVDLYV